MHRDPSTGDRMNESNESNQSIESIESNQSIHQNNQLISATGKSSLDCSITTFLLPAIM
jgi:hypothetical protein